MHTKLFLSALAAAPLAVSAEQVLGVYIFHRHGDRTAKSWKPVNLTALGADEVHSSGEFFRRRYVEDDASVKIQGLSSSTAVLSQLEVTSPQDAVLHNSALVFLQGLYPPNSQQETLANGSKIEGPLSNYQYIPVDAIATAASSKKSENNEWLQGGSGCTNSEVSSNNYFQSAEFLKTRDDTNDFYKSLLPQINTTFDASEANFKNAYTIFDYINVGSIHNKSDIVPKDTFTKLFSLASTHEWNLAYNASDRVRAIAGSVLAGQVVTALEDIVNHSKDAPKFNIQFGAYGTFMSFFGLSQLTKASNDFYGVCDYASSMAFELVTDKTDKNPSADDINVRFFFSNGTAAQHKFKQFPLFGQDKITLSWNDFKKGMSEFAIADTKSWCNTCGNTSGQCAANGTSSDGSASTNSSGNKDGVSRPVAGVIGALVTLVVILGIQAIAMLAGGLRLVKKSTLRQASHGSPASTKA